MRRRPKFEYSPNESLIDILHQWPWKEERVLLVCPWPVQPRDADIQGSLPPPPVIQITHDPSNETHRIAWRVALLVLRDALTRYGRL